MGKPSMAHFSLLSKIQVQLVLFPAATALAGKGDFLEIILRLVEIVHLILPGEGPPDRP